VLRVATFEAFLAELVIFKAVGLDDLAIEKLCAKLQAKTRMKTRILSP
jgi:hypothetical protein